MRVRDLMPPLPGRRPAQAALLTLATQVLVVVLNVLTGIITARLLGATGRGLFAAAILWPTFLSGVAVLGLPSALVYHLRRSEADRDTIVTVGLLLTLAAAVAVTLAGFLLVAGTVSHYGRRETLLAWFCVLWAGPYLLTTVARQVMAVYGRYWSFNLSSYLPPLLYFLLLCVAWSAGALSPEIAAACLMMPCGFVAAWMMLDLRRVWRPSLAGGTAWLRRLLTYALKAAPGDLVSGLLGSLDRLVLVTLLAPDMLGLYAVAYSLSRLLIVQQTLASAVLFPRMAGCDRHEAKRLHDLAFLLVVYVSLTATVLAAAFGTTALSLVYGRSFAQATPVLVVLMAEASLACAAHVTSQLFLALHRPAWVSAAQVASLGVAVAGLLVLPLRSDGWGGTLGAALALMLASATRLALLLAGMRWQLKIGLPRLYPTQHDFLVVRAAVS